MCTFPLLTGQVTKGHLQLPLFAHTSCCWGCCCSQTHTAEQRGPGAALCALLSLDPCVLHLKLPSLSSSQKKLGIVRHGRAQEAPSQSPARCGLLLRHFMVLWLSPLFNIICQFPGYRQFDQRGPKENQRHFSSCSGCSVG